MQLTDQQLRTIQDALEFAFNARLDEFEQDKYGSEHDAIQRAVRAASDAKRFSKVLAYVRQQIRFNT